MKRVFSRITAAILVLLNLVACAPGDSQPNSGNFRVLAPLNNESGKYSLTVTELLAISDLKTLSGKFAKFFFSPRVVGNRLDGLSPRTRFIQNGDGVYVPSDETTMQMVVIYSHLQKLAALDEELGAGGVNKWPRDVGIAVRVSGNVRNNAFYEGKTDSMLMVPYTNKDLPIVINGGILAHEHFHSLFYKMVLDEAATTIHDKEISETIGGDFGETLNGEVSKIPQGESLSEKDVNYYYHLVVTRGLNEGLADFWGWMYTGDPDFITQSLSAEKGRNLNVSSAQAVGVLSSEDRIKDELKQRFKFAETNDMDFNNLVNGYAYTLGTEFARALKRYSDLYATAHSKDPIAARKDVAKVIVKMLPKLRQELSQSATKIFTAESFVNTFVGQTKLSSEAECSYLATLINYAPATGSTKTIDCKDEGGEWKLTPSSLPPIKKGVTLEVKEK